MGREKASTNNKTQEKNKIKTRKDSIELKS
jgi:hypothetical protein